MARLQPQQDRDINPGVEGSRPMRAGVSVFYFEELLDPDVTDAMS